MPRQNKIVRIHSTSDGSSCSRRPAAAAGRHGQGCMLSGRSQGQAGDPPLLSWGGSSLGASEHSCRLGPPAPQSRQEHHPQCGCRSEPPCAIEGPGAGKSPALLGAAAATQTTAAAPGIPALLGAQEGPACHCRLKSACSCCLASPCCWHLLHSWSKVEAEPRHHEWQWEADRLLGRGCGSPVRPQLLTKEGLKAGGQAVSPMNQSRNLWCLFQGCPWLPLDQSAAGTCSPLRLIKSPTQPELSRQWDSQLQRGATLSAESFRDLQRCQNYRLQRGVTLSRASSLLGAGQMLGQPAAERSCPLQGLLSPRSWTDVRMTCLQRGAIHYNLL
ncbi:uncharacterized protein [Macaca nemestrina]|uniref:uncharacterized protein n=1 Tax=Macaca nemestrina TaxID=9545 RepID=UPI0005F547F1|nr:uncharacterized protein LOC105498829 [Macaca nemestrina]